MWFFTGACLLVGIYWTVNKLKEVCEDNIVDVWDENVIDRSEEGKRSEYFLDGYYLPYKLGLTPEEIVSLQESNSPIPNINNLHQYVYLCNATQYSLLVQRLNERGEYKDTILWCEKVRPLRLSNVSPQNIMISSFPKFENDKIMPSLDRSFSIKPGIVYNIISFDESGCVLIPRQALWV